MHQQTVDHVCVVVESYVSGWLRRVKKRVVGTDLNRAGEVAGRVVVVEDLRLGCRRVQGGGKNLVLVRLVVGHQADDLVAQRGAVYFCHSVASSHAAARVHFDVEQGG